MDLDIVKKHLDRDAKNVLKADAVLLIYLHVTGREGDELLMGGNHSMCYSVAKMGDETVVETAGRNYLNTIENPDNF